MKYWIRHILAVVVLLAVAIGAMAQQVAVTQITGLVRDSVSRDAVPYASVAMVGTSEGTMANDKGGFTINTRANFSKLRITAMGYKSKEVNIRQGQGSVVLIDLVPESVTLDELAADMQTVPERPPDTLSRDERELLDLYRSLDPSGREMALYALRGMASHEHPSRVAEGKLA